MAIVLSVLLVVGWAFPAQTQFVLRFIWDLVVLNLISLKNSLVLYLQEHWRSHP